MPSSSKQTAIRHVCVSYLFISTAVARAAAAALTLRAVCVRACVPLRKANHAENRGGFSRDEEKVRKEEPAVEATSQPKASTLFFLMILSISDDSLDKDERETVLVDLGLYEELLDPNEYGGTTLKNQIQYEIEPIVVENQMVGINFYSRIFSE